MATFDSLPVELKICVVDLLSRPKDVGSLSRCNRATHRLASDLLFKASFTRRSKSRTPKSVFKHLFAHAVKHDSRTIIQWLGYHEMNFQLTGSMLVL